MVYTRRDLEKRFKNYNDLITVKHAQEMITMSDTPIFEMFNSNIIYYFKYHKYNYIVTFIDYLVCKECYERWGI